MIGFYSAGAMGQGGGPPPDPDAESIFAKLVSWWDFDGDLSDRFGINHLAGTGSYAAGHIADALTKTSRAEKQNSITLPQLAGSTTDPGLSFGGWIYISGTGQEDTVLLNGTSEFIRLAVRNGNQVFLIAGSSSPTTISSSVGAVAVGNWYFWCGTINTSTRAMELYLNESSVATGTASVGNMANGAINRISYGRVSGNTFAVLRNDSSFVCRDVLTAGEVAWLYNSGAGRAGSAFDSIASVQQSTTVGEGIWTWFNDPRAIVSGSEVVVGAVTATGIQRVYYSDNDFASVGSFDFSSTGTDDDHDNPAFLRRAADNRLVAAYVRHNATAYHKRTSTNADDASAWSSQDDITTEIGLSTIASYANLIELPAEDKVLLYFRNGASTGWTMHVSESVDDGETFGTGVAMMPGGRPYLKCVRNGNARIDFVVTDGHPGETDTSVYHFYYEGGDYFDSDGTSIGPLPLAFADMTEIFDGTTAAGEGWIWDIQTDGSGNPVIAYTATPTQTNQRYRYARWNGSAWVQSEVCGGGYRLYSGEPYYAAGLCLDPDNVNHVYAVRGSDTGWGLYRYVTSDGGVSFDDGTLIYTNAGQVLLRPYIIPGTGRVLLCEGSYTTYNDYATNIISIPMS